MAEATQQLNIIIVAQDRASQVMRGVAQESNNFVSNMGKGIAAGIGFAAFNTAANAIGNAFSFATDAIVGFNASLEQSRQAWTTMLGGASQADAMLRDLQEFAKATPFEFPDVERGARRLLAMGFNARDIIPLLTDIGNAGAIIGRGAEGVDRISLALGQMRARTKVSAEEMLQLTELGIPAWDILAQATGRSVGQIQDAVTKGAVASDVFINAFRRFVQENWGDAMERQSKTFNGAISNIRDGVRNMTSEAFRPLFQALSDLARNFADFTSSPEFKNFGRGMTEATIAVGEFLRVVASSPSTLALLQAGLAGVAAVMAVQFVIAAGQATAALIAFAAANAPLIALGVATAALALVVISNWNEIITGTEEFRTQVGQKLTDFANWLSSTFAPAVAGAAKAAWTDFANQAIGAMNAVVTVWNAFWGEMGQSGQSGFTLLQEQAQEGWQGFAELAADTLEGVMNAWNAFVTGLGVFQQALQDAGLPGLPGLWGIIAGKTLDAKAAADALYFTLHDIPGATQQAFAGFSKFVGEDLVTAIQRTIENVQAAGGDLAELPQRIAEAIKAWWDQVGQGAADAGRDTGTQFGNGLIQTAKPLVEQLARMMAELMAGPATEALQDTDRAIERAKLVMADFSQSSEARTQAFRESFSLQRFVRPRQALEAFDASETVRLATRAEQHANLLNEITKAQLALAGGAAAVGAAGGIGAGGISGIAAPTGLAPAAPPPPAVTIPIQINIMHDDGRTATYEELIEANGQAQTPPIIELSGLRRS